LKVAFCIKTLVCFSVLLGFQALALDIPENSAYQITEIEPGLVEINLSHTGDVTYKNTSESFEHTSLRDVPEMVIDVDNFDFDYYADRYVYWQEVHIWEPWEMLVTDTDQDGQREIIGERLYPPMSIPPGEPWMYAKMYELENEVFIPVHDYPDSTTLPFWAGDLDQDGKQEIMLRTYFLNADSMAYGRSIENYETESQGQLATGFNFEFDQTLLTQINHPNILDLDQDGKTEMLYYLDGGEGRGDPCPSSTVIAEYDPLLNNFVNNFCFDQPAWYTSNYAIDDWDLDGHLEFATGGLDGEMYILETTGPDTYDLVYEDTLDTYNAYMITTTNDINGNGKPELWIGGDQSVSGTKIFCFESSGNNQYEIVFKIGLPGVFSFYDYGVVHTDINLDGIDELMIWTSGYIFILKNTDAESYEIVYAHRNDEWDSPLYQLYFSVTSKDVSGDGYPELLISMMHGLGDDQYFFTKIYQPGDPLVSVQFPPQPQSHSVINAYPNPFNGSITIRWFNSHSKQNDLQIFDIGGRLIKTNEFDSIGNTKEGEFVWTGRDQTGKEVPSGVYFLKLSDQDQAQNKKIMLLK